MGSGRSFAISRADEVGGTVFDAPVAELDLMALRCYRNQLDALLKLYQTLGGGWHTANVADSLAAKQQPGAGL